MVVERSLTLEETLVLSLSRHQPLLFCAVLDELLSLSEPAVWTWRHRNNPCCKLLRTERNHFRCPVSGSGSSHRWWQPLWKLLDLGQMTTE